jgi:hypothetical protein
MELIDAENNQFLFWQDDGSVSISRANREIARNGGMFQSTVYNHMSEVYNKSDLKSTISFHPGPLNRQLSLQIKRGDKGLMTLVTITGPTWNDGPTKDSFPADMPTEWSVFQIGPGWGGGALLVKDGQDIPTRQWIKYRNDGFDRVGLWDGMSFCRVEVLVMKIYSPKLQVLRLSPDLSTILHLLSRMCESLHRR